MKNISVSWKLIFIIQIIGITMITVGLFTSFSIKNLEINKTSQDLDKTTNESQDSLSTYLWIYTTSFPFTE